MINRMIGEGTGGECVQFPSDIDIAPSFLSPEDLVAGEILSQMTPVQAESLSGIDVVHLTFSNSDMQDWQSLNANIWLGKENAETLKFEVQGNRPDPLFDAGAGNLRGLFFVQSVNEIISIDPVPGCEILLPMPDDAASILRLPGMFSFESSMTLEEATSYYQTALNEEGWLAFDLPQTKDNVTVLSYIKKGQELEIKIESIDSGVKAEMFLIE